jgi:Ca2+-binding RTX toxin-like protein
VTFGGNDIIDLGAGADYADGGGGNDRISGAAGADTIFGGGGDDTIAGGADFDKLVGGDGVDVFVFDAQSGPDVIADFNENDMIDLSALNVSFAQLNIQNFFGDTLVTINGAPGVQIFLDGVLPAAMAADDFIF